MADLVAAMADALPDGVAIIGVPTPPRDRRRLSA